MSSSFVDKGVNLEGRNIIVRTVTYHYTGRCVLMTPEWIVLQCAAGVADSGRWGKALETGELSEVEVYPDGEECILNRDSVVDITAWRHDLPMATK